MESKCSSPSPLIFYFFSSQNEQEDKVEGTMPALNILILLWMCDCVLLQGLFKSVTPTETSQDAKTEFLSAPSPTEEKSAALSVAASGVISFIVILVVIVIILVCVVSLRFRCRHCKDAEADKQKPQHPIVTYSCSDAENAAGMKNVLLVSMKDLNTSTSEDGMKPMVTCEE
uniref:Endothelial cell-specific chemotaxis regulator isoform X2 n=1 Tax=Pogona vitticeps TaxID=103695 RepID=A0A6J0TGI4_9SAUR